MTSELLEKKTIGTYMEINPEAFDGWDAINQFLITVSEEFRYKDEDVEFKIIYKPNFPLEGIAPTIGIKVKYLSIKDGVQKSVTREGGLFNQAVASDFSEKNAIAENE